MINLEPVGSVGPRVNKNDNLNSDTIHQGKEVTLLCPAQAYPVPFYR